MSKLLDDLSADEMRRELKERQMDSKGRKAGLRERLQSWILDLDQDPEDYLFIDPFQRNNRDEFRAKFENF